MAQLYRETVMKLSPGEQANLMWQDEAVDLTVGQGKTVRQLPLGLQCRWERDWKETLHQWVMALPKMPWKVKHPDIIEKEFRL